MAQSILKHYLSIPTWRDERDRLVLEVHGNFAEINELELPCNKVSSKEKCIKKRLKTWEQLDDQKFNDFLLSYEGFNSVSFQYEEELGAWRFVRDNFNLPDEKLLNNNGNSYFNEYDKFVAELLTKIHNIKRYISQFQNNYPLGRCVAILVDEISRFMNKDFKERLSRLREKPDASKTILQAIYLEFSEPIGQLETFLTGVVGLCAVGGFLLNMIRKERDSSDKCYQNFFHDILTRSYRRGMEFYTQLVIDWLNNNNLDNDPFFEFFIWDAGKQRCSNTVNKDEPPMIGFDEPMLLNSVELSKFYSPIDVKSFKNRYLIVPELCPRDFDEELRNGIIRIGLYNHVLMLENRDFFDTELNATPFEHLSFDNFYTLHSLVKNRHRHSGRVVLRHLCNQLEFTILMEKLPAYFCGIRNSIIDDFVELTENFNWSGLSTHKNARLNQLNRLYQRAIEQSPLVNDPLSKMILLEFSVPGQVDVSHPPVTNYSHSDRPLTDLELVIRCKDSFGMAFPPTVFELYRNLFRLRHTLRRTFMLLKRKHFNSRQDLSRVELNALALMIRFVQAYDNFVFGYKAPKLVHEYLELVTNGINKETLDLDTFLKEQEQMIGKLHSAAFVSSNSESFSNPMWAILTRFTSYARNESDFNSTCIEASRLLRRIRRYLKSQYDNGEKMPEIAEWVILDSFEKLGARGVKSY